ncbi:MAG: DUF2945 domain-containing protein, partial [Cyanobacteria bacterium J06649_4]
MARKREFHKGDQVEWSSGAGTATGTVQEYITEDRQVGGNNVAASKNDPRYLVENDNTGNVTGHKADALSKSKGSKSGSSSSSSSSSSSGSSKSFSKGDKVQWNTSQGKTTGTVQKKLTEATDIQGYTAKASEDDPQY